MYRFLIVIVLTMSAVVQTAAAQTPEIVVRSTYVTGTALDLVPSGNPGVVDIVSFGNSNGVDTDAPASYVWPYGVRGIPVVVWNNTATPVSGLHVLGMVRSTTGTLRAAVTVPVFPYTILPGEFAFTVVTVGEQLPDGVLRTDLVTFEAYFPAYFRDMQPQDRVVVRKVGEPAVHGEGLIVTVHGVPPVKQLITTVALCFDEAGHVTGMIYDFDALDGSEEYPRSYQVEVDLGMPCDRFLVTAQAEYSVETTVG